MTNLQPPSNGEMRREIQKILDRADLQDRRFFHSLLGMVRRMGLINPFRGVLWAPGLCLLLGIGGWLWFSVLGVRTPQDFRGFLSFLVFFLPLGLTGISLLACTAEKRQNLWEMKAVCRYNDKYLLAFRMLSMGVFGLCSMGIPAFFVPGPQAAQLFKAFLVGSLSFFLCGAFLMAALRFLGEKWLWAAVVAWIGLGLLLFAGSWKYLTEWMEGMPLPLATAGAVAGAFLYIWQTRQMALSYEKTGGFWKC